MNYDYSCPIYMDVLSLFNEEKGKSDEDVIMAVIDQINQGDPVWESIMDDVKEKYPEEMEDQVEDVMNAIDLSKYLKINRNGIDLNYDETAAIGDPKTIAFEIPFAFDFDAFMKDHPELSKEQMEEER